jgi:L-amino acid N-acyltransferase YncA
MSAVTIRPARLADAAAIAAIYNQGIRGRAATFETAERTAEERARWLTDRAPEHPCLVATVPDGADERVVGWAASGEYRSRPCYAGIGEFSVYVHNDWHGQGIGTALLTALLAAAEEAGLWKLVSRIFPENVGSRALCARLGFREVGTYARHARLDGVWRDCVIVERLLPAALTDAPTG